VCLSLRKACFYLVIFIFSAKVTTVLASLYLALNILHTTFWINRFWLNFILEAHTNTW
jgi:hypothetical protein